MAISETIRCTETNHWSNWWW